MSDFDEALLFELAVRLSDRGGINAQFAGELPDRRKRCGTAQRAVGDRETDALRDLCVQGDSAAWIDAMKHGRARVPVCWYSITVAGVLTSPAVRARLWHPLK